MSFIIKSIKTLLVPIMIIIVFILWMQNKETKDKLWFTVKEDIKNFWSYEVK